MAPVVQTDGDNTQSEAHLPPATVLGGQYLVGKVMGHDSSMCCGVAMTVERQKRETDKMTAAKAGLPKGRVEATAEKGAVTLKAGVMGMPGQEPRHH